MKNECKKCGSSWETNEDVAYKVGKCPFCGSFLNEDASIGDYLRLLVCENGIDVLKNKAKINGLLADYFPKNERERNCIQIAYNCEVGRVFCELSAMDTREAEEHVEKLKKRLSEEAWLSKDAIEFVCGVFFCAIGEEYKNGSMSHKKKSVSAQDVDTETKKTKSVSSIYKSIKKTGVKVVNGSKKYLKKYGKSGK